MGVRFPLNFAFNPTVQNANTNTETILVTLPPFSPSIDSAAIVIIGGFQIASGAATTSFSINVRRGTTIAGAVITSQPNGNVKTTTATTNDVINYMGIDQPGSVAGQQYVLTVTQNAATGNGNVQNAWIAAFVL